MREQTAVIQKEGPSRDRKFLGIFLLLGIIAAGLGIFIAIDSIRLVLDGVSVDAQVTNVTTHQGRDKNGKPVTNYTAHIQYKVGETQRTLVRGWSVGSGSSCVVGCYGAGERLKVIYLPEDLAVAMVDSIADLYLFPALALSVGLLFIVFALVMLLKKS